MEPQSTHLWADKQPGEDLYALLKEKQGKTTPGVAREVYDVPHPPLWGRMIASYLWTKSIGAGTLLVAAILLGMGYKGESLLHIVSPVLALIFTGLTVSLLVFDLKRPERFFYILIKPNPKSWLVLGGYILTLYGFLACLWLFFGFVKGAVPGVVFWLSAILAIGSACYSAFLFAQAKGRDLWQSRLFFWHLMIQAIIAGAATLLVYGVIFQPGSSVIGVLSKVLSASLVLSVALILAEVFLTPLNEEVRRATNLMKKGALSWSFWGLVIGVGIILPLIFLVLPGSQNDTTLVLQISASVFALFGLWVFEDLWIKAGQAVPLS
jgi:formate-dependent nitrite reductase membrane component NrfD